MSFEKINRITKTNSEARVSTVLEERVLPHSWDTLLHLSRVTSGPVSDP